MKKFIVGILATLMLCGCMVGVSIAWLTAETTPIQNTFTSGNITLALDRGDATVDTLDLKMVPGKTISCPAFVRVGKDSESCYVFVAVLKSDEFDNYMTYEMFEGWSEVLDYTDPENPTPISGLYYRIVEADATRETDHNFNILANNQLKVRTDVTADALANVSSDNDKLQLNFIALAIQYEYISDETDVDKRASEAWKALSRDLSDVTP